MKTVGDLLMDGWTFRLHSPECGGGYQCVATPPPNMSVDERERIQASLCRTIYSANRQQGASRGDALNMSHLAGFDEDGDLCSDSFRSPELALSYVVAKCNGVWPEVVG